MKIAIETALDSLAELPLWASGRSGGLQWFQFGSRRTVTDARGQKQVGEYALHVQCSWRIIHDNRVVVGSSDQMDVLDSSCEGLFQSESRTFAVSVIEVRDAGSFTLFLQDGFALDVFPDDSSAGEHWRLFVPYSDDPHFVFTGNGVEQE